MTATDDEPEAALPHPFFGQTIARCHVGERVGRGATSSVCRAHYEALDKDIAIKILAGQHVEQLRDNFLAEAQAVAKVDHENVVRVYDVVEDEGTTCILMEYVDGDTLQDRLDDSGSIPPAKALRIALQIARALEAAHAEKIVHRDVKPGNVMLQKGSDTVRMVDFGLAGPKDLTNRAGTPLYMSPEACQGKRIDEKSDVYALGVCLYQMLTGQLPYTGKSVKRILAAHIAAEFVPPSAVRPQLTSKYDDLVKRLMVASKGYRPTAGEAAEMLEPLVAESAPGAKKKGAGGRRAAAGGGRRGAPAQKDGPPAGVIIGIVAVVVVLGVAFAVMSGGKKAETPPQKVEDPNATQSGPKGLTGGTGGVKPATPPKGEAEQAYEKAYLAAKKADKDNATKVKAWKAFLEKHKEGSFADKAKKHLETAETAAAQDLIDAEKRKKAEERKQALVSDRKEIDDKIKSFDFQGASFRARGDKRLPDERVDEWRRKRRRIDWLGEPEGEGDEQAPRFVKMLNDALEAMEPKVPASKVKPTEGVQWEIVGASIKGFVGHSAGINREYAWSQFKANPEIVFEVAKRVVSQNDVDGNLLLAILACELGEATGNDKLIKQAKQHVELAQLVDTTGGDANKLLRAYFPTEWIR